MVPHRDEWVYFPDGGQRLVHAARTGPIRKSRITIEDIIAPEGTPLSVAVIGVADTKAFVSN